MAFTMTPNTAWKNRYETALDIVLRYESYMQDFKNRTDRVNYVLQILESQGIHEACYIIVAGCDSLTDGEVERLCGG